MFLIVGIPLWIVYGRVGMEFGVDNMIWWIAPPAIAAPDSATPSEFRASP